jgi:siroheme synthase-like protein
MGHRFLPVNFKMTGKQCLVVGGGKVALRKINTLLDYDCKLTVIAPEVEEQIGYFADRNFLTLIRRAYKSPEAADYDIVIAASNDMMLNEQVAEDCRKTKVPANVVDTPEECDFTFPAILRRDCLTVSVATDGRAPFLAGQLRVILETVFPDRWSRIAGIAARYRTLVLNLWRDNSDQKLRAYERFLKADWKSILEEMRDDEIEDYISTLAEGPSSQPGTDD